MNGPALAFRLAGNVGDEADDRPARRFRGLEAPGHGVEGPAAADPEELVVVGREVRLDVADVLTHALRHEAVHHALVVGRGLEARAHDQPELDEAVEALERVESAAAPPACPRAGPRGSPGRAPRASRARWFPRDEGAARPWASGRSSWGGGLHAIRKATGVRGSPRMRGPAWATAFATAAARARVASSPVWVAPKGVGTAFGGREERHHLGLVDRTGAGIGQAAGQGVAERPQRLAPDAARRRDRLRKPVRSPPRPRSRSTRIWPVSPSVSTSAKNAAVAGGSPAGSREAVARSGGPERRLSAPTSAKGTKRPPRATMVPSRMARSSAGAPSRRAPTWIMAGPQLAGRVLHRRGGERERGRARLHLRRREVGVAGGDHDVLRRGTQGVGGDAREHGLRGRRPRRGADAQAEGAVLAELELGGGARTAGAAAPGDGQAQPAALRPLGGRGLPAAAPRDLAGARGRARPRAPPPSRPCRRRRGYGAGAGGAGPVDPCRAPSRSRRGGSRARRRAPRPAPGAAGGLCVSPPGRGSARRRVDTKRARPRPRFPGRPRQGTAAPTSTTSSSWRPTTRPPRTADRMPHRFRREGGRAAPGPRRAYSARRAGRPVRSVTSAHRSSPRRSDFAPNPPPTMGVSTRIRAAGMRSRSARRPRTRWGASVELRTSRRWSSSSQVRATWGSRGPIGQRMSDRVPSNERSASSDARSGPGESSRISATRLGFSPRTPAAPARSASSVVRSAGERLVLHADRLRGPLGQLRVLRGHDRHSVPAEARRFGPGSRRACPTDPGPAPHRARRAPPRHRGRGCARGGGESGPRRGGAARPADGRRRTCPAP